MAHIIYAFMLSIVGMLLIYQYGGERCVTFRKRIFGFEIILATFDIMVAGMHIAKFILEV